MEHSDLARLQSWFASYVSGFFTGSDELDRVFKLKQMHTERVCFTIRRLGKALQLSSRDLLLAEVAALLHDVGRFSQFARYRTFRDKDSTNHGRLGLHVVNRHGLLSAFTPAERRHIARALAFHNAAQLPPLADATSLFFLKLLRDADKLDIWRVVIGHYSGRGRTPKAVNEFEFSGNGLCSPAVLAALKSGRVVPIDAVRSVCRRETALYLLGVRPELPGIFPRNRQGPLPESPGRDYPPVRGHPQRAPVRIGLRRPQGGRPLTESKRHVFDFAVQI